MNRAINEPKSLHLLNEIVASDLLSSEAKTPQFKMFLIVHKEGNPAKPVVSSTDCSTTNISRYIDNQLPPHVKEHMLYVKESTDFIWKINSMEQFPDNSIFVTMDVRFLFTNIPIYKYSKQRKKYSIENYLDISPLGFNTKWFCFQLSKLPTD